MINLILLLTTLYRIVYHVLSFKIYMVLPSNVSKNSSSGFKKRLSVMGINFLTFMIPFFEPPTTKVVENLTANSLFVEYIHQDLYQF